MREIFIHNILKANKNLLLLVKKYKLDITIWIIRDNQEQFQMKKKISLYLKI